MIRIGILGDTLLNARTLADLLADGDRLEVVDVRAVSSTFEANPVFPVDVVVAVRLSPDQMPRGGPPLVVLSNGSADKDAFGREIHAWLPLKASPAEIGAAIVAAAHDLAALTQDQVRRWFRNSRMRGEREEEDAFIETLTSRELQVLRMLADGLGNKEIAAQLGISEHTAKFHVAQILAKLGATSRTEAVMIGIRRGLVPI